MATRAGPFGALERALAWRYVRARREHGGLSITAVLSFAGIALAVWALIVIMSIMAGFRATLLDALLGGQPHVIVSVQDLPQEEADAMVSQIAQIQGIAGAYPFIQEQVLATNQNIASGGALVKGITMAELDALEFLEDGGAAESARAAGFGDGRNGGDVILMGAFLASDLRVRPGDEVRLISTETSSTPFGSTPRSKLYTVGGLFRTGSVELDRIYTLMPMEQAQVFFRKQGRYESIDVRLSDPMATETAMRRIDEALARPVYMYDWKAQRAQYFNALNIERNMMRLVMMVLVAITAMNIISGVLMLVKNKTRDIAILRTIGASRGAMMRVFVMIGGALGLTGALVGMVLGVVTVLNIPNIEWALGQVGVTIFDPDTYGLEGLPARLSALEVFGSAIWAALVSVLVTVWPAWRGADIDPVEALRYE